MKGLLQKRIKNDNPGTALVNTGKWGAQEKGFSLIEVLVSLVILGIGILAVAQLQVSAIRGLAFGRHMTTATHLAEQQIEWLRSLPMDPDDPDSAPKDQNNNPIKADYGGGKKSVFYDDNLCDGIESTNWLIHENNPMNELGEPAAGDEMKYYVRWKVERGGGQDGKDENGNNCAAAFPGPAQMKIRLQVIWFEGDQPASLNLNSSFSDISGKKHQLTVQTIRQPKV